MAHFGKDLDDFNGARYIHIRSAEQIENFTVYVITVSVGPYSWTVKHRYSEFYDLHEKLCAGCKLDKGLLPPKKLFGNQTEAFVKKRQRELEIYLQTILFYLAQHVPSSLAYFLDFDKYEIHGITQSMAEDLYSRGEGFLQTRDKYVVTSLQLYALTERLKLPEPTCDSGDVKKDLGHILDFITRAKYIKVTGGSTLVGTSNILMNKLVFDLTLFKSLQVLEICGCNFQLIKGLEIVKQTLTQLEVHESSSSLKEMLLQDCPHWKAEDGSVLVCSWDHVTTLDLSNNSISELHECIQLMPNVENLCLSHNELEMIQYLQWLSQLTYLDLSHNKIHNLDSLHTKLGNVKVIRLAHNKLESLRGFAKLYSLQTLDVTYNNIVTIDEVLHVSQLPCVENFLLIGNMVTNSLDYRTKTLEMFGDRVREVKLDDQISSEKELSTVAVLQALRKAKNTKAPRRLGQSKNASAVSLNETYSQSPPGSLNDHLDRNSPYTSDTGPISSSVPAAIPRVGDQASSLRSLSPVSQDSASSFNSTSDVDRNVKPDAVASSPPYVPPSQIPLSSSSSSANKFPCDDSGAPLNMIPEAHPFDLSCPILEVSKPGSSLTHLSREQQGQETVTPEPRQAHDLKEAHSEQGPPDEPGTADLPQKRRSSWTFNAADLPKMSDQSFMLWLNKQLSSSEDTHSVTSSALPHPTSITQSRTDILDIVWCFAQPLSSPESFISSCAILTSSTIFIEKLITSESSFPGMPELKPLYILPLKNIQQMVIGPCHSFLRLEEAFVGKSGTFTLYCLEPHGVQRLAQKVYSLCQKLNFASDMDCVDLSNDSDLLKEIVSHEEDMSGVGSDRLVLMIPVRCHNDQQFHFLLLSEYRVYCVDIQCALWPPPCFESLPESSLQFNIVHEFSISDKLADVKIHPNKESEADSSAESSSPSNPSSSPSVDFTLYQLSLTVETMNEGVLGSSNRLKEQCLTFKYLFPSQALRDQFLDRLSNLRAEQANRMFPNIREEPEGGNEQLSDSSPVWAKSKFNKNNSNASGASKGSVPVGQSKTSEDMRASSPIPCLPVDKLHDQTDAPVSESFRSLRSSSSESFQSIIESEGTDPPLPDHRSSNAKEDPSTSPMSNFSRASISPLLGEGDEVKAPPHGKSGGKSGQSRKQNFYTDSTSKADSLPSSFDWKKFYFTTTTPATAEEEYKISPQERESSDGSSKPERSSCMSSDQTLHHSSLRLSLETVQPSSSASTNEASGDCESELDQYLKKCVSTFDLIFPLSTKMKPLCLMNGSELRKFFHSTIASNARLDVTEGLAEELHHVLWAIVVPYTNPKQEITTLIMLSTYAVYLVSDTGVQISQTSRPSWMTHSRNQSDSAIAWKTDKEPPLNKKIVKAYMVLKYKDLHQIHVGLFDQCVRLTGYNEDNVFTIATRDSQITEVLIEKFKQVLSLSVSSPMLEHSHQEWEQDFYRDVSKRTKTTIEGLVYTHPSQVSFVYPGDEAIRDVLYLIRERASSDVSTNLSDKSPSLWLYIQCYILPSDDSSLCTTTQPRTIIVTSTHFAVAEEDSVTYPLPDFVRGLPENPCHEILDCRAVDSLKRIHLYHSNPHWLSLSFVEEQPELVVDVDMQHFAQSAAGRERQKVAPEVTVKLFIQSLMERDKLVQMLQKLWKQHVTQVGRILDVQKI